MRRDRVGKKVRTVCRHLRRHVHLIRIGNTYDFRASLAAPKANETVEAPAAQDDVSPPPQKVGQSNGSYSYPCVELELPNVWFWLER